MKKLMNYLIKVFMWETYASELQTKLNKQHQRSFSWFVSAEHEEIGEPRGTMPYKEEQSLIKRFGVKYN